MTKRISAAFCAAAALIVLAACGAAPTASTAAAPDKAQSNVQQAESGTERVPNLFGSGN